ncbi:Homeobox domain-containing protein [Psidium guajava]|nr:Homeobox domain-containing protein [Psidium guajava]
MEAECLRLKQDQLVQFCKQIHSHFSLLFSPPSLPLSPNSPPREPIKAKDDGDEEEEEGECMSMAQENSCTGTRTNSTSKDQPNPEKKSPITNGLH